MATWKDAEKNLKVLKFQPHDIPGIMKGGIEDVSFLACEYLGQILLSYNWGDGRTVESGDIRIPLSASTREIAQAMLDVYERRCMGNRGPI